MYYKTIKNGKSHKQGVLNSLNNTCSVKTANKTAVTHWLHCAVPLKHLYQTWHGEKLVCCSVKQPPETSSLQLCCRGDVTENEACASGKCLWDPLKGKSVTGLLRRVSKKAPGLLCDANGSNAGQPQALIKQVSISHPDMRCRGTQCIPSPPREKLFTERPG